MAISIHLISVPAEEVVTSRVIYLPEQGGELGRAPSCDIALPDQHKRISRVHGQITRNGKGYTIKNMGKNPLQLNDKPLTSNKDYPLSDGDIIKVENYSMLVSTFAHSTSTEEEPQHEEPSMSQPFSLNLEDEDADFLETVSLSPDIVEESPFSHKNVLSDDPFSSDPFEDIDAEKIDPNIELSGDAIPREDSRDPKQHEYLPVSEGKDTQIEASIDKLITITEKNQQYLRNPMLQHEVLFQALEQTIDQFLAELEPSQLEHQFNEYMSGSLFSSKEKRYWRIYRKHFKRRQDSGDFRRQFKALFMENMQKTREEK
ncbi:FHA domain-containing protein [Vibrio sp. TRT 21S02]|uniref:FHA domain-containing protein n=1 Tax=Vibrio sp. TRT 21S02 TaxID=3418507 RepID=UPI003CE85381